MDATEYISIVYQFYMWITPYQDANPVSVARDVQNGIVIKY